MIETKKVRHYTGCVVTEIRFNDYERDNPHYVIFPSGEIRRISHTGGSSIPTEGEVERIRTLGIADIRRELGGEDAPDEN